MPRKMENQHLVSPSRQCSSTLVSFGQVFLSKDNTGASPIFSWPDSSYLNRNQHWGMAFLWCHWHHQECEERAEKAFTKWLPGMFPTLLQLLAEEYSCTKGLFWRKYSLNDCTVLYFSQTGRFWEYSEATTFCIVAETHGKYLLIFLLISMSPSQPLLQRT